MELDPTTKNLWLDPVAGPKIESVQVDSASPLIVGRSAECTVSIPDSSVSRRHVSLVSRNGNWYLTDLGSRHGTYLNGVKLEPERPMLIEHRDMLQIGPYIFRVNRGGHHRVVSTATDTIMDSGVVVETVPVDAPVSLGDRRFSLLADGCTHIFRAEDETQLADAIVELILAGTGFPRGAVLRWSGKPDQVEIISARDSFNPSADDFRLSRSLIHASSNGEIAKLSPKTQFQYGQSIGGLEISEALCVPLLVDSMTVGSIYLDARIGEPPPDPDSLIFCHAVSQIASLALSKLKHIELARRQEFLEADLKIAQEAQAFLLPASHGTLGHLRYASRTRPGAVVGGDLFDIFEIDGTHTGICFGDITGHGIGAAILMTAVLTHLRSVLKSSCDPEFAAGETNSYLADHSSARMFATLWVGVYNTLDHSLTYVDAGHGHWMIKEDGWAPHRPCCEGGLMIGIQPAIVYRSSKLVLGANDRLILYSDGLVEQPNADLDRFEDDRLLSIIHGSSSIQDDVELSFAALERFAGSDRFADDTTIASIEICVNLP